MHENWKSILEKDEQTEIVFAGFWMFLNDVRVWIDSKDLKECNGVLGIGWIEAKLGLPVASSARFFELGIGFLSQNFYPNSCGMYHVYIVEGFRVVLGKI